jgi:2-oxoglutarate dehydrogenase E1 component
VALMFNPSHLEFVDPVAMGRLRAKQDRAGDATREHGLLVLIHGDAAFAGEGIVQETLNLSELEGYQVGGALHVVVNNQLGFTTLPEQGRSTTYATDVAKMLQIPIFHVNGEDPEAVAQAVELALDFRREFRRDVVIDMYCYRRRGHNEADEPAFTQPQMYVAIKRKKNVRDDYLERLLKLDEVDLAEADRIAERSRARLEQEFAGSVAPPPEKPAASKSALGQLWKQYRGGRDRDVAEVETGVDRAALERLLARLATVPDGFKPHPKIARLLAARREMATGERPLDWAAGEALAIATLATGGHRVRLTGQDSERGTFSHRHAVLHDVTSGERLPVFAALTADQAPVEIVNSPLSEAAVLGFEAGYAVAFPDGLIAWEAQFGDFANAAQVIIDQFITSGEEKWRSLSGLVLLLPHGLEGTGPEHASARLERYLSLAAGDNIQVVSPTTPAQLFHCLRRQVVRPWRKPLVVMSPKSMLRHPRAISTLEELAAGRFQRILPDPEVAPDAVRRVLLVSGKLCYDLLEAREARGQPEVAILRVEQLYPLSFEELTAALAPYPADAPVAWVQEEPANMGAWPHVKLTFGDRLAAERGLALISRPAAASPATGSAASHKLEQSELIERALSPSGASDATDDH